MSFICRILGLSGNLSDDLLVGYTLSTTGNPRRFGMPPFVRVLYDDDIAAVTTYVRIRPKCQTCHHCNQNGSFLIN